MSTSAWRRPAALVIAASALALAGCAPTVTLEPAELANDPACAAVHVRLPEIIGELERRTTNAQSTAAWGEPAAVISRCGLPPLGPSDLPCFTVNEVDWLMNESDAPRYVFISYGRTPVTEVIVDSELIAGADAIRAISPAVASIEATSRCLNATDVFGGGTVTTEEPETEPDSEAPAEETPAP